MSMSLYTINAALAALLEGDEFIDACTGEIIGRDALESLQIAQEEKIEGCAVMIKNWVAELDAVKAERRQLQMREKALVNRVERMKGLLQQTLAGKKFKTPKVNLYYGKTCSVDVAEDAYLPDNMVRIIPEQRQPDKDAILRALKAGEHIDGATMVENTYVVVR